MASRSKTSFEKRRKEVARKEKQKLKLERRAQRKLAKEQGIDLDQEVVEGGEVVVEEQPVEAGQ